MPLPGFGCDLDAAAQRLDVAADDVHADAAAGDLGDLLGGREARLEDQRVDLVGRGRCARRDQAALDGRGLIRSVSSPVPSSAISMTMCPPWW